jgi:hypothetical protein
MHRQQSGIGATGDRTKPRVLAVAQQKISDDVVKVGVLADMPGTYSDFTGTGAVLPLNESKCKLVQG